MELQLVSILTALGFGAVIGAYFQSIFEYRKERKEDIHKVKQTRYGAIIMQMLALLDNENGMEKLQLHRPDLRTSGELKEEIQAELLHGILFANDAVINSMGRFLDEPSNASYLKVVIAMRKDLWGTKTSIDERSLEFLYSKS